MLSRWSATALESRPLRDDEACAAAAGSAGERRGRRCSEIVLHLLEKEPDRRYQTAEGLLFDLARLRTDGTRPAGELPAGAHDRPPRLLAPSRLVGREAEVAALRAALDEALTGGCRAVFVG